MLTERDWHDEDLPGTVTSLAISAEGNSGCALIEGGLSLVGGIRESDSLMR